MISSFFLFSIISLSSLSLALSVCFCCCSCGFCYRKSKTNKKIIIILSFGIFFLCAFFFSLILVDAAEWREIHTARPQHASSTRYTRIILHCLAHSLDHSWNWRRRRRRRWKKSGKETIGFVYNLNLIVWKRWRRIERKQIGSNWITICRSFINSERHFYFRIEKEKKQNSFFFVSFSLFCLKGTNDERAKEEQNNTKIKKKKDEEITEIFAICVVVFFPFIRFENRKKKTIGTLSSIGNNQHHLFSIIHIQSTMPNRMLLS